MSLTKNCQFYLISPKIIHGNNRYFNYTQPVGYNAGLFN